MKLHRVAKRRTFLPLSPRDKEPQRRVVALPCPLASPHARRNRGEVGRTAQQRPSRLTRIKAIIIYEAATGSARSEESLPLSPVPPSTPSSFPPHSWTLGLLTLLFFPCFLSPRAFRFLSRFLCPDSEAGVALIMIPSCHTQREPAAVAETAGKGSTPHSYASPSPRASPILPKHPLIPPSHMCEGGPCQSTALVNLRGRHLKKLRHFGAHALWRGRGDLSSESS